MQRLFLASKTILPWLTIFLLAFIPLYPKFPLLNIEGTFVAIRIEDFLIFFVLGLWGINLLYEKKVKKFFSDPLIQAFLIFFFIGGVSLISALYITQTVTPNLAIFHFLRRVEFMMLLPMTYYVLKNKQQIKIALIVLSAVLLLVNLYALGQRYLDWPVISTTNSEFAKGQILYLTTGARVSSTFAGHYDLAVFLAMAIVLISTFLFGLKGFFIKIWLLALFLLSFIVLVMTAARLSFVAALTGLTVSLLLIGKKFYIALIFIVVLIAFAYPSQLRDRFVSTVTVNLLQLGQRYTAYNEEELSRSRLNIPTLPGKPWNIEDEASKTASLSSNTAPDITPGEPIDYTELGVYRSFGIRFEQEWPRAIRAFLKNPFLGTGYSSLGVATDNDFLRSLGEVGVLGSIAFVLIHLEIFKRVWKNFKSKSRFIKYFSAGVLAMIIAFWVNATFIDIYEASKIASLFWMFIGINLAAGDMEDDF